MSLQSSIPAKSHILPAGVYPPILSLYKVSVRQELDLDAMHAHCTHLLKAGVHGFVYQGTNGEAVLLSSSERKAAISMARKAITDFGHADDFPIVAGITGESTNASIDFAKDAHEAGATHALLLSPSYWRAAVTDEAILNHYREVADESPLPIVVYNFPAVTGGIDLNSDQLAALATHVNIVGCKLTCGNVGKIGRLTAKFNPSQFSVFGGSSDYLVAGLETGTCGCVTALGNIFPAAIVRVFELWQNGQKDEARRLQQIVATAEWACKKGIAGTKYGAWKYIGEDLGLAEKTFWPRKPYLPSGEKEKQWVVDTLSVCAEEERRILKERGAGSDAKKVNGAH